MSVLQRTFKSLEWPRLLGYLSNQCETTSGKARCLEIEPTSNCDLALQLLSETGEASSLLNQHKMPSLTGLPILDPVFERARAGAQLDPTELLGVKRLLDLTKSTKATLSSLEPQLFPALTKFTSSMHFIVSLFEAITNAIDDQAQVKDEASSKLKQLRQELGRTHARIKSTLNAYIHSPASKNLQEPIFTLRSGRYVLPVLAAMKSNVKGIVHDTSISGATIFVEPESIIDDGNQVRVLELQIEREVERILMELSSTVHAHVGELEGSYSALITLDVIFAKARLGIIYGGSLPIVADQPAMNLLEIRHPLLILQGNLPEIVPNNLQLGRTGMSSSEEQKCTLIITGPNTGGKTVLLKAIGLFALMLRSGLMIAAQPDSTMSLFPEVLADIGDEQSLEQNLSTFSSHMTNIVDIVSQAKSGSLVLLDEIGVGTDPREGSAIAQATLEYLNTTGALTIVTTHASELKSLAYSLPGFANGSFEFDKEDFRPTYRFTLGTPGSSQATRIAERLGLDQKIIQRTEELLLASKTSLENTIEELENRLEQASIREQKAMEAQARSEQLEIEFDARLKELEKTSEKKRSELAKKMKEEFSIAKDLISKITAELQKDPTSAKAQSAREELEALRKELGWLEEKQSTAQGSSRSFQPGDRVKILSLNQQGTVEKLVREGEGEKDALFEVRAGQLKFIISAKEIEKAAQSETPAGVLGASASLRHRTLPASASERFAAEQINVFVRSDSNTLDLRGMRVEEALTKLDQFVDQIILSETSPAMIIHGHGTGALKQAVRDSLSTSRYPIEFRPGEIYEGGDGVTLVSLK
jgi:DNA mismatch repair protein MutS2